jgi:hypothetical protein
LDDSLQIQQMRQMIDGGKVDAIIICCSNITALNTTIKYGWEKGIPTLSFTGFTTSPSMVFLVCLIQTPISYVIMWCCATGSNQLRMAPSTP